MKKSTFLMFVTFALVLGSLVFLSATSSGGKIIAPTPAGTLKSTPQEKVKEPKTHQPVSQRERAPLSDLQPLLFIENKGQVEKPARFYAKTPHYTLWITPTGLVFDSQTPAPSAKKTQRFITRMIFAGANKHTRIIPIQPAKLRVNYLQGKDSSNWQTNIPTAQRMMYENLYENIDLEVFGKEKKIEYDWLVKPGGHLGAIRFDFHGATGIDIDEQGNLVISTGCGEIIHKKPVSYQDIPCTASKVSNHPGSFTRVDVDVKFQKLEENTYGFAVGDYD